MKFPEQYRWKNAPGGYHTAGGERFGIFIIPGAEAKGRQIRILATDLELTGWDHVSVSLADFPNNTPSWEEMCLVKELFWDDSDCVVQYHPPKKDNVNIGEVLHLWKWNKPFPMPPKECV